MRSIKILEKRSEQKASMFRGILADFKELSENAITAMPFSRDLLSNGNDHKVLYDAKDDKQTISTELGIMTAKALPRHEFNFLPRTKRDSTRNCEFRLSIPVDPLEANKNLGSARSWDGFK
jgi:hypothetical protein